MRLSCMDQTDDPRERTGGNPSTPHGIPIAVRQAAARTPRAAFRGCAVALRVRLPPLVRRGRYETLIRPVEQALGGIGGYTN